MSFVISPGQSENSMSIHQHLSVAEMCHHTDGRVASTIHNQTVIIFDQSHEITDCIGKHLAPQ